MWVTLVRATVTPWRKEDMARWWGENETAERGKPWRQSGVGEGYVMTWKSQLVGHARLWVCEWQEGLGAWPPPTWHWLQPGFKE